MERDLAAGERQHTPSRDGHEPDKCRNSMAASTEGIFVRVDYDDKQNDTKSLHP